MALIQCTNCGHSISDKAVKCPKCGFSQKVERTEPSLTQPSTSSCRKKKTSESFLQRNKTLVMIGVAALTATIVIFFVPQLLPNNQAPQEATVVEEEKDSLEVIDLETKTYLYEKKDGNISIKISIDYPISGDSQLVTTIRKYINEELSVGMNTYKSDLNDGQVLVDYYGEKNYDDLKYDGYEYPYGCEKDINIKKIYEDYLYVSYNKETFAALGGVHPISGSCGKSFSKNDGQPITISDSNSENVKRMVLEALKKQLGEDYKHIDTGLLSVTNPYITKEGVHFDYSQGEIAAMAMGVISVTLPLDKTRQYLAKDNKQ